MESPAAVISVSLASAPLDRLGAVIADLDAAGAGMIHFDVEDGVFTPVMTLGTKMIADLRPLTRLPFDVHLMMVNPEWILPQIAASGADRISVQYEACPYPRRTLRMIADLGVKAGIAFNPATPIPDLSFLHPYLSFVLVLTSEPEIPDSPCIEATFEKVRAGKEAGSRRGVEWMVDGGINRSNIGRAARAGADSFVIGRAVFQDGRYQENLARLQDQILTF